MKLRLHHIEMCVKDQDSVTRTLSYQFGLQVVGRRETPFCDQSVLKLGRTVFIVTSRKCLPKNKNNCVNGSGKQCENGDNPAEPESNNDRVKEEDEGESKGMLTTHYNEPWTVFCCEGVEKESPDLDLDLDETSSKNNNDNNSSSNNNTCPRDHIDSVFNIAIEVKDLNSCMSRLHQMGCVIIRDLTHTCDKYGQVKYAVVKSCCGNVIHTLIEKINYTGWFLPGFHPLPQVSHSPSTSLCDDASFASNVTSNNNHKARVQPSACNNNNNNKPTTQQSSAISYFDHVALVCHIGDSSSILKWYEQAFGMKRFITNRQETEEDGLVIGDDVGMRLKVLEFWKCSEVGLASSCPMEDDSEDDNDWEPLKIVIAESLPTLKNTQVENFIHDHNGPGLQHIGLHTSDMMSTVRELVGHGVRFRYPPPTYYTEIGQLDSIKSVGEDPDLLSKLGILLDTEADVFDEEEDEEMVTPNGTEDKSTVNTPRYLMQIFTYPIFDRDTFFLEVIQRKGARGFGVGNVTALARSVNAYQKQLLESRQRAEAEANATAERQENN